MNIKVSKTSKTPIYLQISSQIKTMIISREIMDGFILPSERLMAKKLGIHRNTVIAAYALLEREDLIHSEERIGYRVSYPLEEETEKEELPRSDFKAVNWDGIIKEEYQYVEKTFDDLFSKSYLENIISFAGGVASSAVYTEEDLVKSIVDIFSDRRNLAFYSPYQGYHSLRQEISNFIKEKGILVNPSEIQIFSEANQAMDFILTLLINPGDVVLAEEYLSPDVKRALDLAGARIITVPMDQDGILCDHLNALIEKHRPKFLYVSANYNDPTGICMSVERKKKILELSYRCRVPIIEDDWTSDLTLEGPPLPTVKALDRGNNVIYLYTFALTMVPGISIAFAAAPKPLIRSLRYLVSVRLLSLDWLPQKLVETYLATGLYVDRISLFVEDYRKKRDLMCQYLDQVKDLGVEYQKPLGGVYLWCRLPNHIDVKKLSKAARLRGVYFMPGYVFSSGGGAKENHIRLSYSNATEEQIREGMKILVELIREL